MCSNNPPFKAADMQGLYRKVLSGNYPPLPSMYPSDMHNMVRSLLQLNPNNRPSCSQILNSNGANNNMSETLQKMDFTNEEYKEGLLGTIKVPRNLG